MKPFSPPFPQGQRPRLLREAAFVAGRWVDGDGCGRIVVQDPATGGLIGEVPDLAEPQVEGAIAAAERAFAKLRAMLPQERGAILRRWADLVEANADDLACILTSEQGKPLAEARGEIAYGAGFLAWFAEEAPRLYGETIPTHLPGARLNVTREPVGPAAAITPWNFPSAMILRKVGAALAAGCPVVALPSSETPFSALALAVLAEEAGMPPGAFQVLTGDGPRIGRHLASDPRIRAVSFTGSTVVGRLLAGLAAQTIKRVTLELGGHAPFIVLEDCDIEAAVAGGIAAKYATSGQDCLAVNRFFVARPRYQAYCDAFTAASARLRIGSGFEADVEIGPLIGERAVAKCLAQIEDALRKGARLLTGGERHPAGPNFLTPTVLADVTDEMLIAHEETFGPVAAISSIDRDEEAVVRANASEHGLAAYVFGRDIARVLGVSGALDYGMVAINTARFTGAPIPFGGFRQSGLGREGGRPGVEAFTELKYVCIGGLAAPSAA